jgi:hypothetical protein
MTVPAAPVDPSDVTAVSEVLAGTLRLMGPAGLTDLLARLPGVRVVPGTPGRMFRSAVEGGVWVGAEHFVTLETEPVVDQHVVGGVTLARSAVPPGQLPQVIARLVVDLAHDQASRVETEVVLTAARETVLRL